MVKRQKKPSSSSWLDNEADESVDFYGDYDERRLDDLMAEIIGHRRNLKSHEDYERSGGRNNSVHSKSGHKYGTATFDEFNDYDDYDNYEDYGDDMFVRDFD